MSNEKMSADEVLAELDDAAKFREKVEGMPKAGQRMRDAYNAVAALIAERDALKARQEKFTDAEVFADVRAMINLCFGSQQEFAKAKGLSPQYVSDILNGRRAMPESWAVMAGYTKPRWQRDAPKRWVDMNPDDGLVMGDSHAEQS